MPKQPIDYSKTIFYRIVCNDLNITDCYIGHTTNFIKRKQKHKQDCISEKSKVYQFIRDNGGWLNWSMIMIDQISCENLNDACKLERKFLEEYKATLNSNIPSRTQKEWFEDNIDKIKDYQKEYNNLNKDYQKEYQKEYYNKNIDKKKEQQKEWREKNKDKMKNLIKEWEDKNKEYRKEYRKEYTKEYYEKNKEKYKERYQKKKQE